MEKKEISGSRHRRYGSQPVSVPFLWEEKPGKPKKDWAMPKVNPMFTCPSPARLIVSVPFQWEEKPGKPLPSLAQLWPEPGSAASFAPILEPSFASDPSIGEEERLLDESSSEYSSNHYESWYSISETDCHSSSGGSATRNASIEASALEFLFPRSYPDAGFLNKALGQDGDADADADADPSATYGEQRTQKGNYSLTVKRTLTLGELILLSRKLSYRMQPTCIRKHRFPMEFIKKNLLTCFPLQTSSDKNSASIVSI